MDKKKNFLNMRLMRTTSRVRVRRKFKTTILNKNDTNEKAKPNKAKQRTKDTFKFTLPIVRDIDYKLRVRDINYRLRDVNYNEDEK